MTTKGEFVDEFACPWCGDFHPALLNPDTDTPESVIVKADCDWPGTHVFTLHMPWGPCVLTRWPAMIPYPSNPTTQESEQ